MKFSTIMKRGLAVGVVGAMAFGLVACGGKDKPSNTSANNEPAKSDAKLKFQQWWGVELPEGYLEKICEDFKAETGIEVELLSAPWGNTKEAIVSGHTSGTVADIVSVDGAWLAEFTEMGLLTDLKAAGVDLGLATDTWKVNGTDYVVPVLNFAYPMYVNMDILEKAGVKEIPKTWSEMYDASEKIKKAGYSAFALNLGTENPNGIQNVYMGTGWASGMALKDGDAYKVAGNEDLKSLAEFWKTMNDKEYLYPGMATLEEAAMTSNFAAGNCAFTLASAATMSQFKDLNFKATTVPVKDGYEGKSGICYASWAVGITENCENKEAAAKFVNYLLGGKDGEVSAGLAATQSAFPNSTVAKPDYSKAPQQFQEFYELYKENYVINEFIGLPNATDVMTKMTNDVVKYLDGDLDADTMLNNWQGYLDEATK